jgi:hypothetical protein
MNTPFLIQRLQKPFKLKKTEGESAEMMEAVANAFAFGGGLKNGGLSDEAFGLLREIWRYDYMGSAEFEFGALPKSFQYIAKNISKYVVGETKVTAICRDYRNDEDLTKKATVYFVCKKDDETEVCEWIKKFANEKKRNYRTKESVNLAANICGEKYYEETTGWHDIDNHYLFFTDREMFDKFCALFELNGEKAVQKKN